MVGLFFVRVLLQVLKIGKNIMPSEGSITQNILPMVVTGNISAPTVVTFIHAHHSALPKPWSLLFTSIS